MGAMRFTAEATGADVAEAFNTAVADACYEYGHGGYTGTIAEKDRYTVICDNPTDADEAETRAEALLDEGTHPVCATWGPAGAIRLDDDPDTAKQTWLFFGWASS